MMSAVPGWALVLLCTTLLHLTPPLAHFHHLQIVERVSPLGRIVATGSGLVALLNSFRTARVNGFALWDAVTFLSIGREPSPAAVKRMAKDILQPYATVWPPAARRYVTPKTLVDSLASKAHGHLTSLRPALLAYTLSRMGDAKTGTPAEVVGAAVGDALGKLLNESIRDTLVALVALDSEQRRVLREVATGGYTVAELVAIQTGWGKMRFKNANVGVQPDKLAALISCLREEGTGTDVVRLQPPYSALLESWIRTDGSLAVAVDNDRIDLDADTSKNLVFIAESSQRKAIEAAGLRGKVGLAVMGSLARNGVGERLPDGTVRPPGTAAAFDGVPGLLALRNMLSASFLDGSSKFEPSLYAALRKASAAAGVSSQPAAAPFEETIGWELLLAFRHFQSHIWADAPQLVRNGLTAAVIADAVHAAACVLADPASGCFMFSGPRLQPRAASS